MVGGVLRASQLGTDAANSRGSLLVNGVCQASQLQASQVGASQHGATQIAPPSTRPCDPAGSEVDDRTFVQIVRECQVRPVLISWEPSAMTQQHINVQQLTHQHRTVEETLLRMRDAGLMVYTASRDDATSSLLQSWLRLYGLGRPSAGASFTLLVNGGPLGVYEGPINAQAIWTWTSSGIAKGKGAANIRRGGVTTLVGPAASFDQRAFDFYGRVTARRFRGAQP